MLNITYNVVTFYYMKIFIVFCLTRVCICTGWKFQKPNLMVWMRQFFTCDGKFQIYLQSIKYPWCCDLNFGLTTKVETWQGKWSGNVFYDSNTFSQVCENAREWVSILPNGFPLWELGSSFNVLKLWNNVCGI
jgi:hypothetical protein